MALLPDLLVARENLVIALSDLPPSLTQQDAARDALLLDLLDYQASQKASAAAEKTAASPEQLPRREQREP